jgi:hypothetical protein
MASTQQWGPPLWNFIHALCNFHFEENNEHHVKHAIECLKALKGAIPCYKCQAFYGENLKELDTINPTEYRALYNWSVRLHNAVNEKLGKPSWSG